MKTNTRIFIFLAVIAAAGVLFFSCKKIYHTKPVDAEDDTSSVVAALVAAPAVDALAPVNSMDDTSTFDLKDSMEVKEEMSKNISAEERCCPKNRRLSYGKHHFRALVGDYMSTPSCANVVCLEQQIDVLDQDTMSHMYPLLTDKELYNLARASKAQSNNAKDELAKRKVEWWVATRPVRIYMNTETSRIKAHKELEDETFATVDLGFIRPDFRSLSGYGNLCLWGKEHVVFQTQFWNEQWQAYWHVKNIHTRGSKEIKLLATAHHREHSFVTILDGYLLVFRHNAFSHAYMLSFASPEIAMRDTPSGQLIEVPDRVIRGGDPRMCVYGVLEIDGVQTLIVAGMTNDELYCEYYVMNVGWTECIPPPEAAIRLRVSIVWKNQLVTLEGSTLYVYNHNPGEDEPWSTKETNIPAPATMLISRTLFLNLNRHLCLYGRALYDHIWIEDVWCLADIESTEWIQMPRFAIDGYKLIGTLPAEIMSTMVIAN